MESPLLEAIKERLFPQNIPNLKLAEQVYEAITDKVFFAELALRLNQQPLPSVELTSEVIWEYFILDFAGQLALDRIAMANIYGDEGWELVTVANDLAYFKRCVS